MAQLYDIGAERAVLAALFQYDIDAWVRIAELINVESFGDSNNQILFKCIHTVIENEQKADLPAILAAAKQMGCEEHIGTDQELKYLKSLFDFPVILDNVHSFAIQIKKF